MKTFSNVVVVCKQLESFQSFCVLTSEITGKRRFFPSGGCDEKGVSSLADAGCDEKGVSSLADGGCDEKGVSSLADGGCDEKDFVTFFAMSIMIQAAAFIAQGSIEYENSV